jgi:quinol monooxygenase YgiN
MCRLNYLFANLFFFGITFIFFSCKNKSPKKAEEIKPQDSTTVQTPVKSTLKLIMIQYPVTGFEKWKVGYQSSESIRTAYGIEHVAFGYGIDNPKKVIVMDRFSDLEKTKIYASTPILQEAMQKAGVTGLPKISYTEVIRVEGSSGAEPNERVMITQRVKDVDAWLKAFDNEGKTKRLEFGLSDRAIGREIEDPNLLYVTFVVTDMKKAKARMRSAEMKKWLKDAGMKDNPAIFFYAIAE